MPNTKQLYGAYQHGEFAHKTGFTLDSLRAAVFPSRGDAMSAFHICLAATGWNPSVVYTLDATNPDRFLYTHPQDANRYLLIGTKGRSQGQEQIITGLWKTSWGPGVVIKKQLDQVCELRAELQRQLEYEKQKFLNLHGVTLSSNEIASHIKKVQHLEEGCKSVWLYVSPYGAIDWLRAQQIRFVTIDGRTYSYLEALINSINTERRSNGKHPIEKVTASDFRDIFSLYVWRQTGGNILALMRVLNHKRLSTTQIYIDNNILNDEHDEQARCLLDTLFSELGHGRLDITIIAHLLRFGEVNDEMKQNLEDFRSLARSRINTGCKDPWNPPISLVPVNSGRRCGVQRCLMCKDNCVILPESQDGIAMRTEELLFVQEYLSLESWLASDFSQELKNCLDALRLFPLDSVSTSRKFWVQEIESGRHRVPGFESGEEYDQ